MELYFEIIIDFLQDNVWFDLSGLPVVDDLNVWKRSYRNHSTFL
jgi:hypothetical protein